MYNIHTNHVQKMLMCAKSVKIPYDIQIALSMLFKMRGEPSSGDQPFNF